MLAALPDPTGNLAAMQSWLRAHPLPPNPTPDQRAARNLVLAAMNKVAYPGSTPAEVAAANAQFARARSSYQAFAAAQQVRETPTTPTLLATVINPVGSAAQYIAVKQLQSSGVISKDTMALKQLQVASKTAAATGQGSAAQAYTDATKRYSSFVSDQRAAETPSSLSLGLASFGLDTSKLMLYGAAAVVALLAYPLLLPRRNPRRRRRAARR